MISETDKPSVKQAQFEDEAIGASEKVTQAGLQPLSGLQTGWC